ncbi:hypothetical protein GCM10009754_88160 [Amycolatopsis minnesotensis]|uniref:Carrier domain-containing protein n=1 Tax=Amycolatopsis minnesotensis TaxID=337894 RepID=A0ABN2T091_9PSEU
MIEEIDAVMPVREVMFSGDSLDETGVTQPVLFAFEVALYRLLESFGITPAVVMGHSVGEIVAAHVAGVVSLGDACMLVSARASLMQALPSGGAMVSLQATVDEVEPLLDSMVSIAAVNAADAVVISGDVEAVERIAATVAGWDRKTTRLAVSHAFHSPLMEPMLDEFARAIAGLRLSEPTMPLISNLTGTLVTPGLVTDPGYWVRHVREAVRFADGVRALDADLVLEIGPKAALAGMVARTTAIPVTATGRKGVDEPTAVLTALANLWVHGTPIDWTPAYTGLHPRHTDLPTRAFTHTHYWLSPKKAAPEVQADPAGKRFWDAVGRLDIDLLAGELGVTDRAALDALVPALSSWRRRQDDLLAQDDLCYQASWGPVEVSGAPSGRRLLVVTATGDRRPLTETVTSALTARGVEVETMELDEDACDRAALAGRLTALGDRFDWVVSLLAPAGEEEPDLRLTTATMLLFQALGDAGSTAKFWCATRNAVTLAAGGPTGDPRQAPLWGLGRSAALENPRRWGGLVDLPAAPAAYEVARLADILSGGGADSELAIRAHSVFARRLARYRTPEATWRPKGTVLVSGGTGALGAEVTGWLAANGAEHVLLLSRGGTEQDWIARLRKEHGTEITVAACDVSDYDRLAEVIDEIPEAYPLTAVIHAAGVLDDGMFEVMTPEQLAVPLAPKAVGALNLHRLTEKHALDRFVLFSSVASTWGNAGQANYAAANAYLDALAGYRRARGLTATTIAWGPWGEGGMAASEAVSQRMARAGLTGLRPVQALDVLGRVLGADATAVTVVDVDWDRFLPHLTAIRPNALLSAFATADEEAVPAEEGPWADLAGLKPAERARAVLTAVRAAVAAVLGHRSAEAVRADQRFADLGFDSLTAVELRNQLIAATGLDLPATLVFDLPTPGHLAEHLDRALAGEAPDEDEFADLDADELIRLALGEDR